MFRRQHTRMPFCTNAKTHQLELISANMHPSRKCQWENLPRSSPNNQFQTSKPPDYTEHISDQKSAQRQVSHNRSKKEKKQIHQQPRTAPASYVSTRPLPLFYFPRRLAFCRMAAPTSKWADCQTRHFVLSFGLWNLLVFVCFAKDEPS